MTSGQPLDPAYSQENLPLVEAGCVCVCAIMSSALEQLGHAREGGTVATCMW